MNDIKAWVIELRREFHRFPEPGGEEKRTAARVEEVLGSLGIETRRMAGTGVVGLLRGKRPGKTIGLRADMDALQQNEQTGLPFASERPGLMHACGHDTHTAMLLGAARTLAGERDTLAGNVVFLFQPAEELAQGAKAMVEAGALEGVDAVFGLHVFTTLPNGEVMPAGSVAVFPGPVAAGADMFKVTVKGRGGHGAMPHLAADTVFPAALMLVGLKGIVTAELNARDPVVLSVGQVHGGTRFNIIADETWFDGSVRYFRPEVSGLVREKLTRIVQGTADAHRVSAELLYGVMVPPTINDGALARLAEKVARQEVGESALIAHDPIMGSEDFSFFASRVPGAFVALGAGNSAKSAVYPNHHPQFAVDEDALEVGVRLHVGFARAFLARP
ncbi:MAG: M20 metallopeptidase family protein [Bacillota bacterium]